MRTLPETAWATPETALTALGNALRRAIAGSSGPFYATALLRAARLLAGLPAPDAAAWRAAFAGGVAAVAEIGGARPGDRTMVDALQPAVDAWARAAGQPAAQAWAQAVAAAEQGARDSAHMTPKLGRASYLGARAVGVPDAGAVAVTICMRALSGFVG
jgi:dihydroxyacetone kinase